MRFYRDGEEVADTEHVEFEATCAGCKKPIAVSSYTADIVRMANRLCKTKEWAPITRGECALCPDCYQAHRRKLSEKAEWELTHAAECWSLFISKWGTGNADDADMERTFARDFPHLRRQMRDWIAKQKTSPSKDAAVGFGGRR